MKISIVAELQDQGIAFEATGENFVRVSCPYHKDEKPSATIQIDTGRVTCFSCNKKSDFIAYLAALHAQPQGVVRKAMEKKYGASKDKTIAVELVELWHKAIFAEENKHLLGELHKRCVSDHSIRLARLGVNNGAITIPVYNENGFVVNVRKYRPGAARGKFVNTKGHGSPVRLYPLDQLNYDKIALCGGEIKALAAMQVLNPQGLGAISTTGGESNWKSYLSEAFKDKIVYVIYDVDKSGQEGAAKTCAFLYPYAREVRSIKLPLDVDKFPHGDINDFLVTGQSLLELLEEADKEKPYIPTHTAEFEGELPEPTQLSLNQAVHAKYTNKRISTKCVISAIADRPYTVPKIVRVACDKSTPHCIECPVYPREPNTDYTIHAEHPGVLQLVEVSKANQIHGIKDCLGIPEKCKMCSFLIREYQSVEDVRISPQLEISDRSVQRELVAAYCVDTELTLNETYVFTGRMQPSPQTQTSTLLISKAETSQDALSLYEHENPTELEIFQPDEWTVQGIDTKLNRIYTDFEANVTHIFQRRSMHLTIDLSYHSVLWFNFRNDRIKGWVEVLVLGDSAQGKSECIQKMMTHYGLGEKVDCKNATAAGLLGGLAQIGKKWFVSWGVIPTHDKRLVILEEMKGLSVEAIAKLTSMRSLGIAEIPKIEKRKTHARTRLVGISNPRSDKPLSAYNFGVTAVRELIGNPEDVRRFDLVIVLSAQDISPETINRMQMETMDHPHTYTSALCKRLILWAWTCEEVIFESENYLIQSAIDLCKKYSETVPLVDAGSMRFKLARLSIALAARTYSHKKHKAVYVRNCHVDFMCKFLSENYDSRAFGYDDYSHGHQEHEEIVNPKNVLDAINGTPYPETLAKNLLRKSSYDFQDIMDWTAQDKDMVQLLVSTLTRENAIARAGKNYYSSANFITLLKEMIATNPFAAKPEFFEDEDF